MFVLLYAFSCVLFGECVVLTPSLQNFTVGRLTGIMQDLEVAWKKSLDSTSLLAAAAEKGGGGESGDIAFAATTLPQPTLPFQYSQPTLIVQSRAVVKPLWYHHTVFVQFVSCIAVMLFSFIVLISIRPPFLYKSQDDKLKTEEFSSTRAFIVAVVAGVLCGVIMFVLGMLKHAKKH